MCLSMCALMKDRGMLSQPEIAVLENGRNDLNLTALSLFYIILLDTASIDGLFSTHTLPW